VPPSEDVWSAMCMFLVGRLPDCSLTCSLYTYSLYHRVASVFTFHQTGIISSADFRARKQSKV